jgi:type II secretory pathway pseudopilin PulG
MMKKKGFTLVELAISIALLATIMVAVGAIFSVVIKTYHVESQRGFFQKELNFVSDAMVRDIKQSHIVQNYDPYILSSDTLILSLPSLDDTDKFIYSGGNVLTDTVVYYRSGNSFYKILFANPLSKRAHGTFLGFSTTLISGDVSNVTFTYSPNINDPGQVTFSITLSRMVGKRNVTLTTKDTANLRNK